MVGGRRVAIDESQSQGEPQQQTSLAEQTQEAKQAKETEHAPQPQLRRSSRIRAVVTPRPDT